MMFRFLTVIVCGLGLLIAGVTASAADEQFFVEAELWIDGVQRGTPNLLVEPNSEASLAIAGPDQVWRLTVKVEPVEDAYAPANTLWMHLGVDQRTGDGWEELTDSLLGVPEGEWATLSVVEGEAESTAETAAVYLRVRASRAILPEA
ncbi:MAG: hypothetical protein ACLFSC_05155 [Wenzhouxiangella sp.]